MSVQAKTLSWRPTSLSGGVAADAFGVMGFYRIIGSPGDWTVICPFGPALRHQDGFETQAAAIRWANADFQKRVEASVAPKVSE